jgi:hypothetical protein
MVNSSTVLITILTILVVVLTVIIVTGATCNTCPEVETPVIIPCNCTHTVETVYVENKTYTIPKSINLTPDVQKQHFPSAEELIDRELNQVTPIITSPGY